jgi:hypothetical protein
MSPTCQSIRPWPRNAGARCCAISTRPPATSIALTAAPRQAASTLRLPVPQPASSTVQRRRSCGSQPSNCARMASRPARTVARMPLTLAVEVRSIHALRALPSKYCASRSRCTS